MDVLEIDRSFVGTLGEHPSSLVIVRAINAAAVSLGLGVVAEGVETPAQRVALEALGCEAAQGCLFSRPLPCTQAEVLLCQTVKPWQKDGRVRKKRKRV